MKHFRLNELNKGWLVGHFQPTLLDSKDVEVAVKHYRAGDAEAEHVHRLATEITVVVYGRVRMCGKEWGPGDIVVLAPGEATDFLALEDAATTVVKSPSVAGDKYLTGR